MLDWLLQLGDPEESDCREFIQQAGALAMGSTTYEWLLANHIRPDSDAPQPWPYTQPAWVFSTRELRCVEGADIRFVSGDVRPVHQQMLEAAAGKNAWPVGGGGLVGRFHDHGLLDELFVQVTSVTLGGGSPPLPRKIVTPPLRLFSATPRGTDFVQLHSEVPRLPG